MTTACVALSAIAPAPDKRHTAQENAAQEAQVEHATRWMQSLLMHRVAEALKTAWVLDCDTTMKPLYGHQAGAELGYHPHKPGRPSHAIHTCWISNLRLGSRRATRTRQEARAVAQPTRVGGFAGGSAAGRAAAIRSERYSLRQRWGDGCAGSFEAVLPGQAAAEPWGHEAVESAMES